MIDYDRIKSYYDSHKGGTDDDPNFLRGTVESSEAVAKFRYRAEARHLERVLRLRGNEDTLDLGGGTGRWATWFAQRCASATMVELAPSLVEGAKKNAKRLGLSNVECLEGSIVNPPLAPDRQFDLIHIGGVLVYVNEDDLPKVREAVTRHARPGARLVIREPVNPAGPTIDDRDGGYQAVFRKPEVYAELFSPTWRLTYQRTTVSHLIPAGKDTVGMVNTVKGSPVLAKVVSAVLPWMGYIDYQLLAFEEIVRKTPLAMLLGDPGVIQHFYVFEKR